jgi:large subunit ribosomal protein L15
MQLHRLSSSFRRTRARRVGRGGKRGKTAGRGTKGQRARAGGRPRPALRDVIKKLPKRRGFGKNRARTVYADRPRPIIVPLGALARIGTDADGVLTPDSLVRAGLVPRADIARRGVKLLARGTLAGPHRVRGFLLSAGARTALIAAGGAVLGEA